MIKKSAVIVAFSVLAGAGPGSPAAQGQANADWCQDREWGRNRQGVCEVRQYNVAATAGVLSVEGTNGGIQVDGEARGDVLVLAKVVATADTEARARQIADAVRVNASIDRVDADGPRELPNGEGWSVSYRLSVPRAVNMSVRTSNGGISIRDMDSKVEFRTTNGGVKLIGLSGDVRGRTSNGGIEIDLDGTAWIGDGLDVETSNGGVRVAIPQNYSARFEARTDNGGLSLDVPGVDANARRERNVSVQLGSGGAPIRVQTSNGGIRVTRK